MFRLIWIRRIGLAVGLALLTSLVADVARAQCVISGGSNLCNGPVELCGPEGTWEYMWITPSNQFLFERCITATESGDYMLRITDPFGETYGPCTKTVDPPPAPPPCAITGLSSGCNGSSVELCGPAGDFSYSWSGPDGFTSTSACVQVSAGGNYLLELRRTTDSCPSSSCEHAVAFASCDTTPPPPPPPPPPPADPSLNCPRAAWFWMRQCLPGDDEAIRVDAASLANIASHIDGSCRTFSWADPLAGFCATMHPHRSTLKARAKRQFAAVSANVCAGELGIPPVRGRAILLDRGTRVFTGDATISVAEWLDATDAKLAQLETQARLTQEAARAYRRIIRVAWNINHGVGIGPVCGRGSNDDDDRVVDLGDVEESLSAQLADDGAVEPAMARGTPNPFSSTTTVTFVVAGGAPQDASIAVFDVAGRKVIDLATGLQSPGLHEVRWNGRGADGSVVRSGVYFVRGMVGAQRVAGQLTFLH